MLKKVIGHGVWHAVLHNLSASSAKSDPSQGSLRPRWGGTPEHIRTRLRDRLLKKCQPSLLLLLLVCGACEKEHAPPQRVFPVVTGQVIERDAPVYMEAFGNIYSPQTVAVVPQVSGILLKTHFQQGQEVKAGDLLFTIDPAPFQAALDQAHAALQGDQAQLELAQKTVERYADLAKLEYVSALNFEQYQTNVSSYQAAIAADKAIVETAAINLGWTRITSPMDGMVGEYSVFPGNLVGPTQTTTSLTTIVQMSPIDVEFSISQADFEKIQARSEKEMPGVEVMLPDAAGPTAVGKVYFIDNQLSVQTGTILCKGTFPNADKKLWPGEFVKVRLLLTTLLKAVMVPTSAIQYGQQGAYIYALSPDGTVTYHLVKVGQEIEDYTVVMDGIKAGDTVITDGQINLHNGVEVIVMKSSGAKKE